ncbi:MAG: D-tyrosyl-tRNA(Tyr) deacylase [Bacteroidetes bacterium]|nr:MAG: D-tyrosyl-tRNA(Tyr) deacylase [Bacteroidota bacterium]
MIAVIQRVSSASVEIDGKRIGSCGPGILILLGVHVTDTEEQVIWVANKCANLRIFNDKDGQMNLSCIATGGEALVISQFTLYGNTGKGNRPSYIHSAPGPIAEPLYELFISELSHRLNRSVESGQFGAMMDVSLVNDGPVTLVVERLAEPLL